MPSAPLGGRSFSRPSAAYVLRGWLVVFAASLAVYAATANRGPQWQDSGHFILSIYTDQLVNPLGLALSHPLHHWLGRLALALHFAEPSYAITLVSSLGAALAVANVFGCVCYLTSSRAAAAFAAISLGVAHTFWHLATTTEVYTLSAALLAGECWCLAAFLRERRRGFLWAAMLLNGLGLANHLQAVLTTPVLAVVVLAALATRRLRWDAAAVGVLLWITGSLPYTVLVAREIAATGDWASTLRSALMGEAGRYGQNVLNFHPSLRILAVSVGFTVLCFPNLLIPAALAGLARARSVGIEPAIRRALLAGLLIHAAFVCRYSVIDQHTFFLPTYVLLAVFGGIGAAYVLRWPARQSAPIAAIGVILLASTPVLYALTPSIARHFDVLRDLARHKPYRDDYVYLFSPWGCADRSAQIMSEEALRLAGSGGLILVEDPMAIEAIEFAALRSGLAGLEVRSLPSRRPASLAKRQQVFREAADAAARRAVVLVPANMDDPLPDGLALRREGDLFVVIGPAS